MTTAIGVVMTGRIVAGRLKDRQLTGEQLHYPEDAEKLDALAAVPASELVELLASHICRLAEAETTPVDAIGVAVPGIIRHGRVEDSPNLPQIKGMDLAGELTRVLAARGIAAPVHVANDADAIAAGVAATRGQLDRLTRVWTIGNGIGYGRWPYVEGVWEGGHITVTLDPKENYCGCGGIGHLEGIMGYRAMRLRFLAGPGRFYFTGHNVGFLELDRLRSHLEGMVKMSPLISYSLEILPPGDENALLGAGVAAVGALSL